LSCRASRVGATPAPAPAAAACWSSVITRAWSVRSLRVVPGDAAAADDGVSGVGVAGGAGEAALFISASVARPGEACVAIGRTEGGEDQMYTRGSKACYCCCCCCCHTIAIAMV
jgi:hypothetical protein